jgi:hypothetical protein
MNKKLETAKIQNAAEKLRADKIQHNLTHALQENIELRTGATASESRVILVDTVLQREGDAELTYRLKDCSQLEDIINCGICGLKMWTPHMYVLFQRSFNLDQYIFMQHPQMRTCLLQSLSP